MARDTLHTWIAGEYVGRFERNLDSDKPWFVYEDTASIPVSLSLLPNREHTREAAHNYLEGLLPENPATRSWIQKITDARSDEAWDLLAAIGGDVQGGVVLHPEPDGPMRMESHLRVAPPDEVSIRLREIKRGGNGYSNRTHPPRFSLAGAQAKFAMAWYENQWYWPDHATPSTHIFKPESLEHSGLELIEAATLELARRVGIEAPRAEQTEFVGETTYMVERFDRVLNENGLATRVHVEDMTQALGRPVEEKYQVHTDDIAGLLRDTTGDDELGYQFYRQYAFNSVIGNSDAHGKNYSIMLGQIHDGSPTVSLSPLYDAIPVGLFPGYDEALSMPVGWADNPHLVTRSDWIESAENAGLDTDRVLEIVSEIARGVQEHLETTIGAIDHRRVTREAVTQMLSDAERQSG